VLYFTGRVNSRRSVAAAAGIHGGRFKSALPFCRFRLLILLEAPDGLNAGLYVELLRRDLYEMPHAWIRLHPAAEVLAFRDFLPTGQSLLHLLFKLARYAPLQVRLKYLHFRPDALF